MIFFNISEWAELNHRDNSAGSEVIESGSGSSEVAMDTGNPWDSKPLAASTITPFDNPFDSPAKSSSANVDEGWANFSPATVAKTIDEDSEMSPVKADFEAAFGSNSPAVATDDKANVNKDSSNSDSSEFAVTSSPKKSPTVTTTEENIP